MSDGVSQLVAGIKLTPIVQLLFAWNDQLLDRIRGVLPVDQLQIVIIGSKDIRLSHFFEFFTLVWWEVGDLVQGANIFHPFGLFGPVDFVIVIQRDQQR